MAVKIVKQMKKSAQDATTVSLTADNGVGESHPGDAPLTTVLLTFTATPASMFGSAIADGRKFRVTVEQYT